MKLSLIGSGGHARSVISLLSDNRIDVKNIYDDSYNFQKEERLGKHLLNGKIKDITKLEKLILALGDNTTRQYYFEKYFNQIHKTNIVHSSAVIDTYAQTGEANLFFARSFINYGVKIGYNNILNTASVVEHECVIGNHNHISVGTILCGRVRIGNNCFLGAGSVLKDGVQLGDEIILGAGTVVVKNIMEKGTYVGVPAKKIKS